MGFLDHLEELRWRIIKIIISILAGGLIVFWFIDLILEIMLYPISRTTSINPLRLQVLSV